MTDPVAVVPKTKRWPIALLVGLLSGIAGAVLCVPFADGAMEAHHVSNFEGGRGFAVACLWLPLAFVVSFLVGFVVSLQIKRSGFVGYLIRQGVSLAIVVALVAAGGGLGYATADHPPLIDGKRLALEIEVQIPAKGRAIEDLQAADFGVALVVSASDRNYSDLRWIDAVKSNESIFVTAWAPLNSRNAERDITVGLRDEKGQIFHVMLPPSPKKTEDEWSEWMPPRERFDHSKPSPEDQYLVRYRVRFDQEYSPTPRPTQAWSPSPSPEESPTPNESSTP